MTTTKVVLLACGSYNPVTNAHLRMFEIARDALNRTGRYQVVKGIVSPVSDDYKKKDLESAKHRSAMLEKALMNTDWVRTDTWECDQKTWLETAKVLSHFKDQMENDYGNKASEHGRKQQQNSLTDSSHSEVDVDQTPQVKLLCGADLLESLAQPGLWTDEDIEYIVSKHGLVVITRSGSDPHKFIYESDILSKHQENIFVVTEWMFHDISATKVRRALRRGDSIKYVVQDSVIDYIKEHQLYRTTDK